MSSLEMGFDDQIWYIVHPQNILNKILFERHLTISTYSLFLDGRNPASPAAERMQKLPLKMSQEKKDAQREKERLSKNAKRQVETQEESAQCKKTDRDCKMRKWLFETQEESAQRKKTMQECVTNQRQTETEE